MRDHGERPDRLGQGRNDLDDRLAREGTCPRKRPTKELCDQAPRLLAARGGLVRQDSDEGQAGKAPLRPVRLGMGDIVQRERLVVRVEDPLALQQRSQPALPFSLVLVQLHFSVRVRMIHRAAA